jgi:hypothetical protein
MASPRSDVGGTREKGIDVNQCVGKGKVGEFLVKERLWKSQLGV